MDIDPGSILDSLGPARRFADPSAPHEARMLAAGGALPLPPLDVAKVLFALTFDPDPEVKERARTSLETLPDHSLDAVVPAEIHPGLLDLIARRLEGDEVRLEKLALNPACSDETLCWLAARPFPSVVDAIAHNQLRLLHCDHLLEVLGQNPLTGAATIERILEFVARERGEGPAQPQHEATRDADAEPAAAEDEESWLEEPDLSQVPQEFFQEQDEDGSVEEEEDRTRSLQALMLEMSVVEKIKLARFGNGEARNLLVRDRNRIVATAAIRSPKLTENEVTAYAKSRQVCDEVIRVISTSRDWTRSYPIKHALATNPKTPMQTAIKFCNYLTDRDLKNIMKSRDVPAPVSQQARRILARKGKI